MPQFPFSSEWIYAQHAVLLCLGLWLLCFSRLRLAQPRTRLAATISLCGVGALYTFWAGEPTWPLEDFQDAYYPAGVAVLSDPARLLDRTAEGVHGFVNLPIVAYLFAPFALLDVKLAAILFTLLGAAAAAACWYCLVRLTDAATSLDAALLLFLFAVFGPLHNSLKEGNTSHIVLLVVVAALLLLRGRRDFSAGLLLALAAVIKLPLLLFGAYFVLRRRWGVVAGGASMLLVVVALSIALFGWNAHVQWYDLFVRTASQTKILAFNVQSVQAFFGRLEADSGVLRIWDPQTVGPLATFAGNAVVLLMYGLAAAACALPAARTAAVRDPRRAELLECSMVVVLACVTSPLSWSHYYTWLLLPAAVLLQEWDVRALNGAQRMIGLAVLLAVAAPVVVVEGLSGALEWLYTRFLVSHLFFGGLLVIGLLLIARIREPVRPPQAPQ